jgi:tRNA(Ile)-lysidine synthase
MRNAPPEAAVSRFRADFSTAIGGPPPPRVGLCVSGGPDSLALLLLAQAGLNAVEAATVDHGLRETSSEEASFVAGLCTELSVPHSTLVLGKPDRGNLSAWARRERYGALREWAQHRDLDLLVTAHHADDQLETIVMRLNRGSGVAGLAGVRAFQEGLVRPLLGWRKAELEAIVAHCGIEAIDDPSNSDDRFDRARLRKALAQADWLDPIAAARSAAALAEAEVALSWTAQAYYGRRTAEKNGIISFDPRDLPREILRRVVLLCLTAVEPPAAPRGDELDRLISGLAGCRVATLAGVKCSGGVFWHFERAPARTRPA